MEPQGMKSEEGDGLRAGWREGEWGYFVILEHLEGAAEGGGRHFDLLVDPTGEHLRPYDPESAVWNAKVLLSWKFPWEGDLPREMSGRIEGSQKIGNHRRVYRVFEGDIGGGRGTVRRVATGVALLDRIEGEVTWIRLRGDVEGCIGVG